MINLFLIRGLPSSGKSTLAERLGDRVFEADQFFMEDGEYRFDPKKLADAHAWCQQSTAHQIVFDKTVDRDSKSTIVVSNTFTARWEMQPYIEMAKEFGVRLTVVDLFDGGCDDETLFARNQHGVPLEAFRTMRQRYEHDWRVGNPIPPWQR